MQPHCGQLKQKQYSLLLSLARKAAQAEPRQSQLPSGAPGAASALCRCLRAQAQVLHGDPSASEALKQGGTCATANSETRRQHSALADKKYTRRTQGLQALLLSPLGLLGWAAGASTGSWGSAGCRRRCCSGGTLKCRACVELERKGLPVRRVAGTRAPQSTWQRQGLREVLSATARPLGLGAFGCPLLRGNGKPPKATWIQELMD